MKWCTLQQCVCYLWLITACLFVCLFPHMDPNEIRCAMTTSWSVLSVNRLSLLKNSVDLTSIIHGKRFQHIASSSLLNPLNLKQPAKEANPMQKQRGCNVDYRHLWVLHFMLYILYFVHLRVACESFVDFPFCVLQCDNVGICCYVAGAAHAIVGLRNSVFFSFFSFFLIFSSDKSIQAVIKGTWPLQCPHTKTKLM